jgi:hypothetical protein
MCLLQMLHTGMSRRSALRALHSTHRNNALAQTLYLIKPITAKDCALRLLCASVA